MPRAPQAQRASKALLVRRFQARKAANRGWLLVFFAARVREVRGYGAAASLAHSCCVSSLGLPRRQDGCSKLVKRLPQPSKLKW